MKALCGAPTPAAWLHRARRAALSFRQAGRAPEACWQRPARLSDAGLDGVKRMQAAAGSSGDAGRAGSAAAAAGGGLPSSPGVSSVEVYGFVGWITSSVAYVLFILWAYTPNSVLEAHGVTYYPDKYWAVALPCWACVTVVFAFWLYEGLCMMSAPPAGDPSGRWDAASRTKEQAGLASYFVGAERGIPPLADVPPEIVSMVLHGGIAPRVLYELWLYILQ